MIEPETISLNKSGEVKTTSAKCVLLSKIVKRFRGGVTANRGITIDASAGDVHAILGENGAGKTTLMKVLAGLFAPDSGHIEIDGIEHRFANPLEAKRCGIGMVHQRFSLVPALTVAENLALSHLNGYFFLNPRAWRKHITFFAEEHGLDIRPDVPVSRLSIGEQQRVEIFRLILEGARILILDEPTSILAPQESEILFTHLRRLATNGSIIFLVTHKIHHVRAVASRVSVLRRGELVASRPDTHMSNSELASLMVGSSSDTVHNQKEKGKCSSLSPDDRAVTVRDLSVAPLTCAEGLKEISFSVQRGEILGVAGISGNGQDELAAAITGSVRFHGDVTCHALNGNAPRIGYIPSDRTGAGVALSLPMEENLALRVYRNRPFTTLGLLNRKEISNYAKAQIDQYNINPSDPAQTTQLLSGGNMQKVILARELDTARDVLVAANPTAGLDVNTVTFVNSRLIEKARQGCAILLISEDLDELFALSDRILVLRKGRFQGILDGDDSLRTEVGLLMSNGEVPERFIAHGDERVRSVMP